MHLSSILEICLSASVIQISSLDVQIFVIAQSGVNTLPIRVLSLWLSVTVGLVIILIPLSYKPVAILILLLLFVDSVCFLVTLCIFTSIQVS